MDADAYIEHRVNEVCNRIDEVEEKMDRIDRKEYANFKYIQKQFDSDKGKIAIVKDSVEKEIKAFKSDVYRQFDEVYRRFDEIDRWFEKIDRRFDESDRRFEKIDRQFDETKAFARNRLCTRLSSSIYKIYALVRDENGQPSYEVHPDFPVTVRDFWQLKGNSKFCLR
jgi:tetrahydromethanopterin S-methyltransferase subunit G